MLLIQLNKRPAIVLLLAAVLLFIFSFIIPNGTIDVHLHDTYIIIGYPQIFWVLAIFLLLVWLIYILCNRVLFSIYLSWIHIIATILCIGLLLFFFFKEDYHQVGMPRRYVDFTASADVQYNWAWYCSTLLLLLLCTPFILLVNIVLGLFKKKKL
jgi:heme/copper-type cytochrome/quinol oxidase subunit 1